MSAPSSARAPSGPAVPGSRSAAVVGGFAAFAVRLAFLAALAVFAASSFLRHQHAAAVGERAALALEQRALAAELAGWAPRIAAGEGAAESVLPGLRRRALGVLVRLPPEAPEELRAAWVRIVTGLDGVRGEWRRIRGLRARIVDLRVEAAGLRDRSLRLANLLNVDGGSGEGPPARPAAMAVAVLFVVPRAFAAEMRGVEFVEFPDTRGLDRAAPLLALWKRAAEDLFENGVPPPAGFEARLDLADLPARIRALGEPLAEARAAARALAPARAALERLAADEAALALLAPRFEAATAAAAAPPPVFGVSNEAWRLGSGAAALAALLVMVRRRGGGRLPADTAPAPPAFGEAAGSERRLRGLSDEALAGVRDAGEVRAPGEEVPHEIVEQLEDIRDALDRIGEEEDAGKRPA